MQRLDTLQAAHWQAATGGGDHKAAHLVIKLIMQRCTLLGLDRPDQAATAPVHSIVIGGTTEEYIASLRALSEGNA